MKHTHIVYLCIALINITGYIMFIYTVNDLIYLIFGYSELMLNVNPFIIILIGFSYMIVIQWALYYLIMFLGGEYG